jgi:SsrA-binding protein
MLPLILNKRAKYEFEILESIYAGLVLLGGEVKMLRGKHGSLAGSYVRVVGDHAVLLNAQIPPYPQARNEDYDPLRTRDLLVTKDELLFLKQAQETKGRTLVPVVIGLEGRFIKVQVAVARGKNTRDRREVIKKRDLDRELRRDL